MGRQKAKAKAIAAGTRVQLAEPVAARSPRVMVTAATFVVKFPAPLDVEEGGTALSKVYDALLVLARAGVIADFNCSETTNAEDVQTVTV